MALSSGFLWEKCLAHDSTWCCGVGLQEVSSSGRLIWQLCCCWRGRLVSVTSALCLLSVPKPGHVCCTVLQDREAGGQADISLCTSLLLLSLLSWKHPSHLLGLLRPLHEVLFPQPRWCRVSSVLLFPFERDSIHCRAGRMQD